MPEGYHRGKVFHRVFHRTPRIIEEILRSQSENLRSFAHKLRDKSGIVDKRLVLGSQSEKLRSFFAHKLRDKSGIVDKRLVR